MYAPPVKNLVCAPPSDTPGMVYGSLIISAMNSAFEPLSGPRNSTFRSPASDRSIITSIGCLPCSSAMSPTLRPTYPLQVGLAVDALDDEAGGVAADAGLDDPQPLVGFLGLVHERLAQLRVLHLLDLLFLGARGDGPPRRRGVVQVPVLEREGEAGAAGAALGEDRQALLAAALDPAQRPAVDLGILAGRSDGVEQDRPLGHRRQLLQERQVGLDVAGGLRDLDEALVALGQHLGRGRGCPRRTWCR